MTILVHGGAGDVDESTWEHKYNASKAAVRAVYNDLVSRGEGNHIILMSDFTTVIRLYPY